MYEDEYYFIQELKNREDLPFLKPDKDTANRHFRFEALPIGQAPLRFHNAWKEESRAKGIRTTVPDILFDGADLVVRDKARERLLDYDLPNLHIYPAIYIDDKDNWHEDRWYLTFTERFDCWDRNTSDYNDKGGVHSGDQIYYNVFTYKFNQELMSKTPLKDRLLFKLGGTLDAYIVAHVSILVKVFGDPIKNGAEYTRVSDY